MFRCCIHASVAIVWPLGFWFHTCRLQLLCTEPLGPNSWIATTTSPTSHSTKSMNAPIMTMEGSSRRCAISTNMPTMKMTPSEPTVM